MTDIMEFLRARLTDEERAFGLMEGEVREHTLHEIFALRRTLGRAVELHDDPFDSALFTEYAEFVLPNLAVRYSDHPDYREDWQTA